MDANFETVALLSRRPTILHLPPRVETKKDRDGDVVFVEASTPLKPGSRERPVATVVSLETWQRVRENKAVKQWLALGWLAEQKAAEPAPTETPPPESLGGYAGPAALALVETEQSEATLRMWLAVEGRPPIKEAITKRLALVAKPAKQAGAK